MAKKKKSQSFSAGIAGRMGCCKVESVVSVDERGQMVLPKELRDKANIRAGDKLAVVGMEKDGPLFGDPVPSGALVMGRDGVAVDATAADLMGFDPGEIEHLAFMAWAGLGLIDKARLDLRGANPSELRRNYVAPPKV